MDNLIYLPFRPSFRSDQFHECTILHFGMKAPESPPPSLSAEEVDAQVGYYRRDVGLSFLRAREQRGFTQRQLAVRAGVSLRRVVEVEAGGNPTLDTVGRLCIALNVTPAQMEAPSGFLGATAREVAFHLGINLLPRPAQRRGDPIEELNRWAAGRNAPVPRYEEQRITAFRPARYHVRVTMVVPPTVPGSNEHAVHEAEAMGETPEEAKQKAAEALLRTLAER